MASKGSEALEGPSLAGAAATDEGGGKGGAQQPGRRPTWHVRATSNLAVEDASLLRGMPPARGLRGLGSVLSARPPTAQYYELSAPVERIDTFVSHNWTTPRWRKFLVLVFHFNIGLASVISCAVALGACGLTASGALPSALGLLPWRRSNEENPRGILCLPLGLAAFIVCLCFVHELDWMSCRRCARRHTVFLDKTCVHQTVEERKRDGIRCLAAFLARSDAFLVVYSDIYMGRLWTVYECASWLLLHPGQPIIVRPVLFPIIVLSGLLVSAIWDSYIAVLHASALTEQIPPAVGRLAPPLVLASAMSIAAWLMARLAEDHEAIETRIAKFSLADAKCASEDDRLIVQANIVAFMKLAKMSGPDDSEGQVFEAFEALVKREVPRLMWSSSSRIGMPYLMAICPNLPRFFGSLDGLVGFYLASRPMRSLALRFLLTSWNAFLVWPITLAFIGHLTRRKSLRSMPACAGIGISAFALMGVSWVLGEVATIEAETSDVWLALMFSLYGLSLLATWKLYTG